MGALYGGDIGESCLALALDTSPVFAPRTRGEAEAPRRMLGAIAEKILFDVSRFAGQETRTCQVDQPDMKNGGTERERDEEERERLRERELIDQILHA